MTSTSLVLYLTALVAQAGAQTAYKPIIDNEHAAVFDTASPGAFALDFIAIQLSDGKVVEGRARSKPATHGRTIVVELKDYTSPPLENKSGYPIAFPRPGSIKVMENHHAIVWDYTWRAGVATPMHFHDKDVVVVYLKDGSLKSTLPSGESVVNDYKSGQTKFNTRDRTHTETLVKGSQRAIIVEFK